MKQFSKPIALFFCEGIISAEEDGGLVRDEAGDRYFRIDRFERFRRDRLIEEPVAFEPAHSVADPGGTDFEFDARPHQVGEARERPQERDRSENPAEQIDERFDFRFDGDEEEKVSRDEGGADEDEKMAGPATLE